MTMDARLRTLGPEGLRHFQSLHTAAVEAVTERFYATHGSAYQRFGPRGRQACREDLAFHLEFLRPVLEFGLLQPMVDYLRWLGSVLAARAIPHQHLALSLDLLRRADKAFTRPSSRDEIAWWRPEPACTSGEQALQLFD